ncbi:hypothetical protein LV82_00816 [Albidovulum inexpectatum]|uniref:Uncharacterized protein n=1 Tax=Albidovulum inexpectatum TaxID=196587 RepID=A0A2S5JJB9_9RHOB|nr:hypothetical protein LV82_00816 [Albidovulum inexpectatum]
MNIHRHGSERDPSDPETKVRGRQQHGGSSDSAQTDTAETPEEQMRPRDFCGFLGDWAAI